MRFEWDESKNRQNLLKHDIRFETAALVFDDPRALSQTDQFCDDEERWVTIGMDSLARILVVAFTWREDRIRLISARLATPKERKQYEEGI